MNNQPIGIFDSGVGGLSVFAELIKLMGEENYIYFGDTKNLPYGNKSKEELIKISKNIFDFFETKNVKAVVMACNTTSANTYNELKNEYNYKIYPIVQTVSKEIALANYDRIGVFATQATINSHAYKREIRNYNLRSEVFEIACPAWADIAEKRLQNEPESIEDIKSKLNMMLEYNPDKIILGCTHYPYLIGILSHFAPLELFINPAKIFAQNIYQDLKQSELLGGKKEYEPKFYVSSNAQQFKMSSKLFYDVENAQEIEISKFPIK